MADISKMFVELKQCKDISSGKTLHSQVIQSGLPSTTFTSNTLVNMYVRCASMTNAQHLFDVMPERNTVTWNCLIRGYVENGQSIHAIKLFHSMQETQPPDARTYVAALSACANLATSHPGEHQKWLAKGRDLHKEVTRSGLCDIFVRSTLVSMYSDCGCMTEARRVFDEMVERNVVSWNSLIQGYAKCGQITNARRVFDKMVRKNVVSWFCLVKGYVDNEEYELALETFEAALEAECAPDERLYVAAVTACGGLAARKEERWLEKGRAIHCQAVKNRRCNMFVESSLVDMYSKFGCMQAAREVFDGMAEKDTVSWNFLIQGYSQCGDMTLARRTFDKMVKRNVLSWHCLIWGYVTNGESETALEVFAEMDESVPDEKVYVAALTACTNLASKADGLASKWSDKARDIHSQAVRNQRCDMAVESMLVDFHAKRGNMREARELFDGMSERATSTWNSLVRGYVEAGESELGLQLISSMRQSRVQKDSATYVAALLACANLLALQRGEEFHAEVVNSGLDKDVVLQTCLVEFYGKCGKMELAKQVFDSITGKDIMSWNALMRGYSRQGNVPQVFQALQRMKEAGIRPNEITFTYILATCSHAGLTERGKECFEEMISEYGVCPTMEHYSCMVDLLGRANHLDEALSFVRGMPVEPNVVVWHALLSACRKWKNVEVGRVAYKALLRLDQRDGCSYVLMADMYKDIYNVK